MRSGRMVNTVRTRATVERAGHGGAQQKKPGNQGACHCSETFVNYQKIACWGDSQTFGARTYGCYPLYLVRSLNQDSRYAWHAISFCQNGYTARDLWFRLGHDLMAIVDTSRRAS